MHRQGDGIEPIPGHAPDPPVPQPGIAPDGKVEIFETFTQISQAVNPEFQLLFDASRR
jgi:hypothetical protein